MQRERVLVAGVGGASLGTEIVKALDAAGRYSILACDISPLAFGHYMAEIEQSFVVEPNAYVASVLDVCERAEVSLVVAGAEGAMVELAAGADAIRAAGVTVVGNGPEV